MVFPLGDCEGDETSVDFGEVEDRDEHNEKRKSTKESTKDENEQNENEKESTKQTESDIHAFANLALSLLKDRQPLSLSITDIGM